MNNLGSGEKTILYYPTIRIEDGYWLRNAILYWDSVASIVPSYNFDEINSPEVEYLRQVGIYKPLYPVALESDETVCRKFCDEVKLKLKQSHRRKTNDDQVSRVHREKLAMGQNTMLHINKTPVRILDFLKDEGIVIENCDGPWLDMKTSDAEVYMSVLAKYLAQIEGNTDIGTDLSQKFFKPYTRSYRKNERKQLYLDMAIQEILPTPNLNGVSLEEIVDFRMEHENELHYFRHRIEDFQDKLKYQAEDVGEFQEKVIRFKQEIADNLRDIECLLEEKRIPFNFQSLRSLIPIGVVAGVDFLSWSGHISELQEIITEMAIGMAVGLFKGIDKNQITISKENAYLFYAKKRNLIK